MRWVRFVLSLVLTLTLVIALSIPIASLPFSAGDMLEPFGGFWQGGEKVNAPLPQEVQLPDLQAPATVVIDDRGVPHVFAQNQEDLFFLQGYLTARDRLWQMDFQTRFAAGRLSEVVPVESEAAALEHDREFRRMGMVIAAERLVEKTMSNPETRSIVEAYSRGVNAWIESLSPSEYPFEYRMLNYAPEPWTPLKTALFQKFMAYDLTARANDLEHTQALQLWGKPVVDLLYPEHPYDPSPIVPIGTRFRRRTLPQPVQPLDYFPDSLLLPDYTRAQPDPNVGSNNWVISGVKSATGKPILANDPHLGLNLPSVWYEMQLSAPGINVYGVTMPGAPAVIIGFNDSIAWGVTNAVRDVMDFYRIEFRDETKAEYRMGDSWKKTEIRKETYRLKSGKVIEDTLLLTEIGPVMFDEEFGDSPVPLAVRWMAHFPSNELAAFVGVNKAHSYTDFTEALRNYVCPAQNFAFASKNGDIALRQQGQFANLWPGQGRFVMDGTDPNQVWNTYVPFEENPFVLNRARGYISSANQHPADVEYPYFYYGSFEQFRNRRINQLLEETDSITIEDMKRFQLDNYSLMAAELLPVLLADLDTTQLTPYEMRCLSILRSWDYMYEADAAAPVLYQGWYDSLNNAIWNDELEAVEVPLEKPGRSATISILKDSTDFLFYDRINTPARENRKQLVQETFSGVVAELKAERENPATWQWAKRRDTKVRHLMRIPVFSQDSIYSGGHSGILNATSKHSGPSWRMVVSLEDEIKAYGVYPGGQSGNVGSPRYDNFIDTWEAGEYFELWFMKGAGDTSKPTLARQLFKPKDAS